MNYNRSNSNNFARTCSRLSQFLKERTRRSLGDQSCFAFPHMSPAPSSKSDPERAEEEIAKMVTRSLLPKNMEKEDIVSASEGPGEYLNSLNLFPLTSPSVKEESPKITANMREFPRPTEEPKTTNASMTIFYAGKVLVFDEFPEDKALEVISLAIQGITKSTNPQISIDETQTQPQSLASSSNNNMVATQDKQDTVSQEPGGLSDLPIARRTSLFRFIEKRKDRVASAAPYQIHNNSSTGMLNSNPRRYNAVMRNLCHQHQEEQKQKRLLELNL